MKPEHAEVVVRVGAEGGSLTLFRVRTPGGEHRFCVELNVVALHELMEALDGEPPGGEAVTRTRLVSTLEEGLQLLDDEPWVELYPIEIHRDHAAQVWAVVEPRLKQLEVDRPDRARQQAEQWRALCGVP
jgi:hypothetical protein